MRDKHPKCRRQQAHACTEKQSLLRRDLHLSASVRVLFFFFPSLALFSPTTVFPDCAPECAAKQTGRGIRNLAFLAVRLPHPGSI